MFCTSKRSMPNDETEDLSILRMTIKRLECLENERKTPDTNSRKIDVSQLQNQILANIKTVEKHFKHYLDVNGYNETVLKPISGSTTSVCDVHEIPVNVSLFEVIKKFEYDVKRLEDDCQEYKLRIKSLQESEERYKETVDRLRKDLQTSEISQYELNDQIADLEQTIEQLKSLHSLKIEEVVRVSEENTALEERLTTKIIELEGEIHTHKVALIKVNTKYTLTEADRFKLEGEYAEKCREVRKLKFQVTNTQEKLNKLQKSEHGECLPKDMEHLESQRTCSFWNKYDEILSCMSTLFTHHWVKARQGLAACGKNDDYIAEILRKILQTCYEECQRYLSESLYKTPASTNRKRPISTQQNGQKVIVDKLLNTEFKDVNYSSILEEFTERSIIVFWKVLVKCKDVRFNWNNPVNETADDSGLFSSNDIITVLPLVYVLKSK
uniref:Paramyosin-like isoform X2 n=1 Tax=Crassostrea virginica TaxID=6565 RepID=A0A8B8D285_CRAVI|nr:paramyosin-like isoform X2 [Crassostrea virginica]